MKGRGTGERGWDDVCVLDLISIHNFKALSQQTHVIDLYKMNSMIEHMDHIVTDTPLRDWSLITGRGGLQNGKIAGPKLFAPPPQDRVKLFAPPLLKTGKFTRPHYNMAKTSSYRLKSTPKLFVPPLQNG